MLVKYTLYEDLYRLHSVGMPFFLTGTVLTPSNFTALNVS